ncbi:MAG: CcoQ/FixQ family Cbb3-type cytochrome c oxidase assembly chaperone [Bacteroidetes bacterium]|nr:CcoQ/FixQ family Cbb3-type cytochrome c oxidase assembly chaperone [Bacteroidota bacterium]MBS1933936.1 CcoQ/FixQ family Cbb3-type cytochrome c oxidase assembly chaperone [Bacteroidota bacterium]
MKFINYIEKVSGIDIYGLTSLGIFMTIFLVVLIGVWKADKNKIKQISEIPLN